MSLHVFANVVTPYGTAANNRGTTDGNTTTLQKLLWQGETHTTVSAESIRFALRRLLQSYEDTNRTWNESANPKPRNEWKDDQFSGWASDDGKVYIDDDLLGFMSAQAAKEDGAEAELPSDGEGLVESDVAELREDSTTVKSASKRKSKNKTKGTVNLRRGVLELTRAISITPWSGDVTFNANTPWSNLGSKDKDNPGPYIAEMHATRYQYGFALTPERLRDRSRASIAIQALCKLGNVAGNQGRFLFDFSPETIVIRITDDPAPRLLYTFTTSDNGANIDASLLIKRVIAKDVEPSELWIGVSDLDSAMVKRLRDVGVTNIQGVKATAKSVCSEIEKQLGIERQSKC